MIDLDNILFSPGREMEVLGLYSKIWSLAWCGAKLPVVSEWWVSGQLTAARSLRAQGCSRGWTNGQGVCRIMGFFTLAPALDAISPDTHKIDLESAREMVDFSQRLDK